MTNGASLDLWFYSQEVSSGIITAVDKGVKIFTRRVHHVRVQLEELRPSIGAGSDEDAFMTTTAA
jgi:hypothetical protein